MARNEDGNQQPVTGLEIALQWATLPPEHLRIALKALEPQLAREHEFRMAQARAAVQDRRAHVRYMAGLIAGFSISLIMLVAAVVLGTSGQVWLAGILSGPSILALAKLFVLRQSGADDLKQMRKAQISPNAAAPPAAPTTAPDAGPVL